MSKKATLVGRLGLETFDYSGRLIFNVPEHPVFSLLQNNDCLTVSILDTDPDMLAIEGILISFDGSEEFDAADFDAAAKEVFVSMPVYRRLCIDSHCKAKSRATRLWPKLQPAGRERIAKLHKEYLENFHIKRGHA